MHEEEEEEKEEDKVYCVFALVSLAGHGERSGGDGGGVNSWMSRIRPATIIELLNGGR